MSPHRYVLAQPVLASCFLYALLAVDSGLKAAQPIDRCTFHYAPVRIGDEGEQQIEMQLKMTRELSQSGTQISSDRLELARQQRRRMTVLDVHDKVATSVRVTFVQAEQTVQQPNQPPVEQKQPIDGKSYRVTRVGEELEIRAEDGHPLDPEEEALVATAMTALGRPNPLGRLLDGKTLKLGDEIAVPSEVVQDFFGEQSAQGSQMKLKLVEIPSATPQLRAVFATAFRTPPSPHGDPGMQVTGRWELDTRTCQTVSASFQGPIQSQEQRGPEGAKFQVTTRGQLDLRLTRGATNLR